MNPQDNRTEDPGIRERIEALEARVLWLETARDRQPEGVGLLHEGSPSRPAAAGDASIAARRADQDRLEFEVGTVWFSRVGIMVLALGAGFAISLPYRGLPPFAPSAGGFLLVAAILYAAHRWSAAMGPLAGFIRGGGVILFHFATLRLFYFGDEPVAGTGTAVGMAVLVVAPALSFLLAAGCRSAWLAGIATLAGLVSALIVPAPWFSVGAIVAVLGAAAWMSARRSWPWLLPVAVVLGNATLLLVMLNRPVLGNPVAWVIEPAVSAAIVLAYSMLLAIGSMLRTDRKREEPAAVLTGFLNAGLGFLVYFLTTEAGANPGSGANYLAASAVLLAIATGFWVRERSRLSTFAYAMTGYLALTVAITKFSTVPDVFAWLSMQSLVVVATAVWFQSRFIVSANFLIYIATIAGYFAVAQAGSGISFLFGAVALGSARILVWQKERLHIRTELMRNGYLTCGFLAFPYALYHLVPRGYVGISWVGLALFYYLMNLAVNSRKYRWMGHATLLGTVLYLIVVGIIQLKPAYRILSFVVLGVVLVGVSLVFSLARGRAQGETGGSEPDGPQETRR